MCGSFALCGRQSMRGGFAMFGRSPLRSNGPLRCRCAMRGFGPLRGRRSLRRSETLSKLPSHGGTSMTTDEERQQALREVLFAEHVLCKSGDTVLLEVLRGVENVTVWQHYPVGDVFDPESGAQWYYHAHDHPGTDGEHGHFHCFIRPEGREGPVHHLIALGVDAHGRLLRLFTVNQWVVGDEWLEAEGTVALLPRFDMQLGRPSYLVNRWLTALIRLYGEEIATLIRTRDKTIAAHTGSGTLEAARQDRALEVTSGLAVNLADTARILDHP